MIKIELNKQYRTRDGRKVKLLCVDALGERPIVGLIPTDWGTEAVYRWLPDGRICEGVDTSLDLIPIKEKRSVKTRIIVLENGGCTLLENPISKPDWAFAIIEIDREVERGDGLDKG